MRKMARLAATVSPPLGRRSRLAYAFAALLIATIPAAPQPAAASSKEAAVGPANATIYIIRHAEKPAEGRGLSPLGEDRARAYVGYFAALRQQAAVHLDTLIATADTDASERPRLTLEPLARATGLPIRQSFANDDVADLASWLRDNEANRTVLIAWHHGKIDELVASLGGDTRQLLAGRRWPAAVYDWLIVLRYDSAGRLIPAGSNMLRTAAVATPDGAPPS